MVEYCPEFDVGKSECRSSSRGALYMRCSFVVQKIIEALFHSVPHIERKNGSLRDPEILSFKMNRGLFGHSRFIKIILNCRRIFPDAYFQKGYVWTSKRQFMYVRISLWK